MGVIKISTFNAASLVSRKRRAWLRDLLYREAIDVLCVQETKISNADQEKEFVNCFKDRYLVYHSMGVEGRAGTAVMIKKRDDVKIVDCELEQSGRVAAADLLWKGKLIRVISVYAPNSCTERKQFFTTCRHFVNTPSIVILGGDFNCVTSAKDCTHKGTFMDSSVKELRKLLTDYDLVDCMPDKHPDGTRFTHWQGTCHARLDRMYISGEEISRIERYTMKPDTF